jgi:hypothetical protein
MTLDAEFLFDNQLISEVESLIKNSKNELLLISPFIDLDRRIMDALNEKIKIPKFKLRVLFGKNEKNIYKSVKKDSIDFLKTFPNVEIRYEERLHAKFYLNDTHFMLTSLNLYDYSLAKNIETGILVHHTSKGLIGKLMDDTGGLIANGVDKIKTDVLGMDTNEVDPIVKFNQIYENADVLYKTEPVFKEVKGINGLFGKKEVVDRNVLVDKLKSAKIENTEKIKLKDTPKPVKEKLLSATNLGKLRDKTFNQVVEVMISKNYIQDKSTITNEGEKAGLQFKQNAKGTKWIVYPESLAKIL